MSVASSRVRDGQNMTESSMLLSRVDDIPPGTVTTATEEEERCCETHVESAKRGILCFHCGTGSGAEKNSCRECATGYSCE